MPQPLSSSPVQFSIIARSARSVGGARLGRVRTPHGDFDTPAFMPVGTRGSVKGIMPHLLAQTGAQIILGNTYHLLLRPGPEVIQRLGGLQRFTGWGGPMLTDSGGYQAYSLADTNRIDEDGVTFKSIVDGSDVHLSPERAIDVQNRLGADIIMAFDDCPPSVDPGAVGDEGVTQPRLRSAVARDARAAEVEKERDDQRADVQSGASRPFPRKRTKLYDHAARLKLANERTVRWLERCKRAHEAWKGAGGMGGGGGGALFGIIQGGTDLDQRAWCVERITNIELPGYAIGGVAVGEQPDDIARVVAFTAPRMPDDRPRYLMGVGYERDLLMAVLSGVDMFDCVLPTRNGRNANAFTPTGQMRLRNAKFAEDPRPIQEDCDCAACAGTQGGMWAGKAENGGKLAESGVLDGDGGGRGGERGFSRAYIRHLFMAQEMLGPILVSLHNLRHFQRFMADIRRTIGTDDWEGLVQRWPVAEPGLAAARRLGVLKPGP